MKILENKLLESYPNGKIPKDFIIHMNYQIDDILSTQVKDKHKTILLKDPHGEMVLIDKNIVELIKYIWKANIETLNSCENNRPKNYIWIQFAGEKDLKKFLNILFIGIDYHNDIYQRACVKCYYRINDWIYHINWEGFSRGEIDGINSKNKTDSENNYILDSCNKSCEIVDLFFGISLRFPNVDYLWVLNQIKKYVKSKKILKNKLYLLSCKVWPVSIK